MKAKLLILAFAAMLASGCTMDPQDTAAESSKPTAPNVSEAAGNANATIQGNSARPQGEITMEQVAAHNTKEDCWMAVSGDVLDLSGYATHPDDSYVAYCGKDGTEAFNTKGDKGTNHSQRAFGMLGGYAIGRVAE